MSNRQRATKIKIAIPAPPMPGENDCTEWLHAVPVTVNGDDKSGVYCLRNMAFYSAFSVGDLVDVRRINGRLEVTGLRQRGGRSSYFVRLNPTANLEMFKSLCHAWSQTGSWIENLCEHQVVISVEDDDPVARPTYEQLEQRESAGMIAPFEIWTQPNDEPDDADLFGHLAGRVLQVAHLQAADVRSEVRRDDAAVTLGRVDLTAQQAVAITQLRLRYGLDCALRQQVAKPRGERVVPDAVLPVVIDQVLGRGEQRHMLVVDAGDRPQEEGEVVALGEAGQLRDVVQPDVDHPLHAGIGQQPEERLR